MAPISNASTDQTSNSTSFNLQPAVLRPNRTHEQPSWEKERSELECGDDCDGLKQPVTEAGPDTL
jgi:hypothetical protein